MAYLEKCKSEIEKAQNEQEKSFWEYQLEVEQMVIELSKQN